jgi:hypothetical protein
MLVGYDEDVGSHVDHFIHLLTMSAYHLLADPCLSLLLRDSHVFYEVYLQYVCTLDTVVVGRISMFLLIGYDDDVDD